MPAFALNLAVDALLKREFDQYRRKREPHPLMVRFGIHAIPFAHPDLDTWRENFKGVEYFHTPTNFLVCGAPDDVWIGEDQKLIVVDYKATSTVAEISMEDECRMRYKRQIEIYQWLLRKNGFEVSETGYFSVNADKQKTLLINRSTSPFTCFRTPDLIRGWMRYWGRFSSASSAISRLRRILSVSGVDTAETRHPLNMSNVS